MTDLDPDLAGVVVDIEDANIPAWHEHSVESARRDEAGRAVDAFDDVVARFREELD